MFAYSHTKAWYITIIFLVKNYKHFVPAALRFFEHMTKGLRVAQPVGLLEPPAFSLPGFSIFFRSGYIQVINT
tara:strand:+ start:715 stop:933 length:219 start_codon:yes stop_codon:yes gene_type:complete